MKHFSPSTVAQRIKICLAEQGFDVDRLFANSGLEDIEQHKTPNADPLELSDKFSILWDKLAATSGDSMLGFRVDAPHPISWLGPFGHLLMAGKNLKTTSENISRYLPLISPAMHIQIEHEGKHTSFSIEFIPGKRPVPQQRYDFTWNVFLSTMRFVANRNDLHPILVEYAFPMPTSPTAYSEKFGCPVHFNATRNALIFATNDLTTPIPTENSFVSNAVFRMLDEKLTQIVDLGLKAKVRNLLATTIEKRGALREKIAQQLLISERTLQRRLESEGTDFSTLVDDVRKELAFRCLHQNSVTLKELSFKLGFSDPRALHRACVRWFGKPPSQLRLKNHRIIPFDKSGFETESNVLGMEPN